ncbi:MAG: GH3 auxin-responsive promoter family protein, partial [Planctomycetota bacterium]|nr:GH3 auxin-responsive promoter family protein [Planctomycetota bacterium]
LRRLNCEYDAKRGDGRLAPPRCLLLADRSYENWRARLVRDGRPDGQLKLPVLATPPGPGKAPLRGCPVFDNLPLAAELY